MKYDHVYDSSASYYEKKFEFDDREKPVNILLEKENVILQVDASGNAVFYTLDGDELYREKVESTKFFYEIYLIVSKDVISVRFPVIEWIDHYPNCDGEYDRWSQVIRDNYYVKYAVGK